jgi:dTMP kinase
MPLVIIEGLDGVGKSTLANGLANYINSQISSIANEALVVKAPGGTKEGLVLRQLLLESKFNLCKEAELLCFAADLAQLFETIVRPALKLNKFVICDRYIFSTVAYQIYGKQFKPGWAMPMLYSIASGLNPKVVLYLELPPEQRRQRLINRGGILDRMESNIEDQFWSRVECGFEDQIEHKSNLYRIDCAQSSEQVLIQAIQFIESVFVDT